MKKIIVFISVFLIVMLAALSGIFFRISEIRSEDQNKKEGIESIQEKDGFPVEVVSAGSGAFDVWREIQGRVEGFRQAVISTPNPARVAAIRYKVGDHVTADTPIISLDENDPKNSARITLLESVYEDALREYERYESLYKSGGISADVKDKMALKLKTARTNLDAARTTVHLTSPINGTLMSLYVREREAAEPGKILAMVSSLDKIRVVAGVSDRDVAELSLGQQVTITAATGVQLSGKVERISLGANTETGLFDLEMVMNNQDRALRVGTFVTARVRIFHKNDGVYVDSTCILRDFNGRDFLFQADKGTARKVFIEKIAENDTHTLVSGINPDLPVIIKGKSLLTDGAKLRILNARG